MLRIDPKNADKPLQALPDFIWRDGQGMNHAVSQMDTDYLFRCVGMIWNNARPDRPINRDFKRYSFNPRTHSADYLSRALGAMLAELFRREEYLSQKQLSSIRYILTVANIDAAQDAANDAVL